MKFNIFLVAVFLVPTWASLGQDFHLVFLNKKENKPPMPENEENVLMEKHSRRTQWTL